MANFSRNSPDVVVAIYIGTKYSCYAYLPPFNSRWKEQIAYSLWTGLRGFSFKAPTCVLIESDGRTARAFGYEAKSLYSDDPNRDKLYLFSECWAILDNECRISLDFNVKDDGGKRLPALRVLSLLVRWLKEDFCQQYGNHLESILEPHRTMWVLVVPAIWHDSTKHFMRQAANEAGLGNDELRIVTKPTAAAYFCRYQSSTNLVGKDVNFSGLPNGAQYMVLDADGGTVDITIHEVVDNWTDNQIGAKCSCPCGEETVIKAFYDILDEIAGPGFLDMLRKHRHGCTISEVEESLENRIVHFKSDQTEPVNISFSLCHFNEISHALFGKDFRASIANSKYGGKVTVRHHVLSVPADVFKGFFKSALEMTIDQVDDLLQRPSFSSCNHIILVGHFYESNMVQEAVKKAFPGKTVIIPTEAERACLTGAAFYGHVFDDVVNRKFRSGDRKPGEKDVAQESEPLTTQATHPDLVVAIDIGTSFSGYAFSKRSDFMSDPTKINTILWKNSQFASEKVPTCILIEKDGKTTRTFGYGAESEYASDPEMKKLYLFKKFKMILYKETDINDEITLDDVRGKSLRAITVFSLIIKSLVDNALNRIGKLHGFADINQADIVWVLTVPAIWNEAAKRFMRDAAIMAGIPVNQLRITLEPEAASLFCRYLPQAKFVGDYMNLSSLPKGTQTMVLDAGGGTVDICIHEVVDNQTVKEIAAASGGPWGGETVIKAFYNFLEEITGPHFLAKLRQDEYEEEVEMITNIEHIKRKIDTGDRVVKLRLPLITFNKISKILFNKDFVSMLANTKFARMVTFKGDTTFMLANLFRDFFTYAIEKITNHVKDLLGRQNVSDCEYIIMVGGFSECTLLQEAIKKAFPGKKVIIPAETGLTVLKGAVVFGHDPSVISQRISRYTYGIRSVVDFRPDEHPEDKCIVKNNKKLCKDIFSAIVKAGDCLTLGQPSLPIPVVREFVSDKHLTLRLYAVSGNAPKFVTDKGCNFVREMKVDLIGSKTRCQVRVILGGTELQVQCTEDDTGKATDSFINFLG